MLLMFFFILEKYKNIIQIDGNKIVKVLSKNVIHHMLKNYWSVDKTKGHDVILKMAMPCTESCLPFVSFLDSHEVVGYS